MPKYEQLELKKDDKEDGETGYDDVPNTKSQLLALTFNIHTLLNKKERNPRGHG